MIKDHKLFIPTILLLIGGTSYGSVISANKLAIDSGFPFIAYAFWQMLIASAVLCVFCVFFRCPPRMGIKYFRVYALTAIFGLSGPLLILTFLADKLPPSVLTLMVALIAPAVYLLALAVRAEQFRWLSVLGVALGFIGVVLIIIPEHSLPDPSMAIWVLFALLLPASAAINNVYTAKLMPSDVNSLSLTAGLMMITTFILFIIMLLSDGLVVVTNVGMDGVWPTLWAAAGNALTYICFFEIIRRAGPIFFAQLNYVVVAAGVVWAYLLFGETPTVWLWAAIAVIAIGLAVMNFAKAASLRQST